MHYASSIHAIGHSTAKHAAATVKLLRQVRFYDSLPSDSSKRIDVSKTTVDNFEVLRCSVCLHTKSLGLSTHTKSLGQRACQCCDGDLQQHLTGSGVKAVGLRPWKTQGPWQGQPTKAQCQAKTACDSSASLVRRSARAWAGILCRHWHWHVLKMALCMWPARKRLKLMIHGVWWWRAKRPVAFASPGAAEAALD